MTEDDFPDVESLKLEIEIEEEQRLLETNRTKIKKIKEYIKAAIKSGSNRVDLSMCELPSFRDEFKDSLISSGYQVRVITGNGADYLKITW